MTAVMVAVAVTVLLMLAQHLALDLKGYLSDVLRIENLIYFDTFDTLTSCPAWQEVFNNRVSGLP